MVKKASENDIEETAASDFIDQKIADLGYWRGDMLARVRAIIKKADPDVVE